MKIAYKAPYWPPEGPTTHAPNGIVSYLGGACAGGPGAGA